MSGDELVEALLAVTPEPPDDGDPEVLLAMFHQMNTAREQLIDASRGQVAGRANPERVALLQERDALWILVLTAARDLLGRARGSAKKLGKYAETSAL